MSGFFCLIFLSCQFAHMSFCDLKHWSSIMIIFFKSWHFSVTNCMSWVISARNYPLLYCQHYIQQIARSKLVFLSTLPQFCQNIGHMNFLFLFLYLFWYFLFTLISIQSNKTITKKKSQDVHYQKYKNSPCLFANNNHKILFTLNVPC